MSDENVAQYDPSAMMESIVDIEYLILVGQEAADLLAAHAANSATYPITVNVVIFPHVQGHPTSKTPFHGTYTGKLVSATINDRHTKGRFTFEDGITIYRDSNFLE